MSQVIDTPVLYRGRPEQIAALMTDNNRIKLPTCGLTAVHLVLENEDESFLEVPAGAGFTWGYGNPTSIYSFDLTDAETALLKLGTNLSAWIKNQLRDHGAQVQTRQLLFRLRRTLIHKKIALADLRGLWKKGRLSKTESTATVDCAP